MSTPVHVSNSLSRSDERLPQEEQREGLLAYAQRSLLSTNIVSTSVSINAYRVVEEETPVQQSSVLQLDIDTVYQLLAAAS